MRRIFQLGPRVIKRAINTPRHFAKRRNFVVMVNEDRSWYRERPTINRQQPNGTRLNQGLQFYIPIWHKMKKIDMDREEKTQLTVQTQSKDNVDINFKVDVTCKITDPEPFYLRSCTKLDQAAIEKIKTCSTNVIQSAAKLLTTDEMFFDEYMRQWSSLRLNRTTCKEMEKFIESNSTKQLYDEGIECVDVKIDENSAPVSEDAKRKLEHVIIQKVDAIRAERERWRNIRYFMEAAQAEREPGKYQHLWDYGRLEGR